MRGLHDIDLRHYASGGTFGVSATADTAALDRAIADVSTGGVIRIPSGCGTLLVNPASVRAVNKACTIVGDGGRPLIEAQAAGAVFDITASNVTVANLRGVGFDNTDTDEYFVKADGGTWATKLVNVHLRDLEVSDIASAYWLECVDGFSVTNCDATDVGWNGVRVMSGTHGTITGGVIRNVQALAAAQSYGVALSRRETENLTTDPHAENITVTGVVVDGSDWEAFDTHAGRHLTFANCVSRNATLRGFAMVGGDNQSSVETYGPKFITMTGCVAEGTTDAAARAGFLISGAGAGAGSWVDYADGITMSGCVTKGHGRDHADATTGAVTAYGTRGLSVDVTCYEPAVMGVNMWYENYGFVVRGTVIDPWSDAAARVSAFACRGNLNRGMFTGVALDRGTKSATRVAEYGLWMPTTPTDTHVVLGDNQFDEATIAATLGALVTP